MNDSALFGLVSYNDPLLVEGMCLPYMGSLRITGT